MFIHKRNDFDPVGGTETPEKVGLNRRRWLQIAGLGAAPHYLYICRDGAVAAAGSCGAAANQVTRRAAFVLLSTGVNAQSPPAAGGDEARNLDGDAAFVSREASSVAGREFDDIVQWGAIHLVVNRLVLAGRLP